VRLHRKRPSAGTLLPRRVPAGASLQLQRRRAVQRRAGVTLHPCSADGPRLALRRCIRMALVHDIAEAIVGDITPHCKVPAEEKHRLESGAIAEMQAMLGPETDAGAPMRMALTCCCCRCRCCRRCRCRGCLYGREALAASPDT
jgi:hypothetical protein